MAAGTRPVAVLVNNTAAALPQRGVPGADAVVECLGDNGVTRLMALYANPAAMPQVGPVQDARDQQLQLALPLNAIIAHIGGNVYTENFFNAYSYQDLDGRYIATTAFAFDSARAPSRTEELCWYTDASLVAAAVASENIPVVGESYPLFSFAQDGKTVALSEGDAPDVGFAFSDSYSAQLQYQADSGTYVRLENGSAPADETSGATESYKNVVILFANIGMKADNHTPDFDFSAGSGYYICGGKYQSIQWKKGTAEQPLVLTDADGKAVTVNTGKCYVAVVGADRAASLRMNVDAPASSSQSTPAA